jgi:hypothetical protein
VVAGRGGSARSVEKEAESTTLLVTGRRMVSFIEGPPNTAAAERFDLGSLVALAA